LKVYPGIKQGRVRINSVSYRTPCRMKETLRGDLQAMEFSHHRETFW